MLLLGSSAVVVVDRASGAVLASHHRVALSPSPSPSPSPPPVTFSAAVVGDVDGDGYADVVVVASDGSPALFTFSAHLGSALFPRLLTALIVALSALCAAHLALQHSHTATHHWMRVAHTLSRAHHA